MPKTRAKDCTWNCFCCEYSDCIQDSSAILARERKEMREKLAKAGDSRKRITRKKVKTPEEIAKQAKDSYRRRYDYRRQNGLCVTCGAKANDGKVQCEECRIKGLENKRKRKQAKLDALRKGVN